MNRKLNKLGLPLMRPEMRRLMGLLLVERTEKNKWKFFLPHDGKRHKKPTKKDWFVCEVTFDGRDNPDAKAILKIDAQDQPFGPMGTLMGAHEIKEKAVILAGRLVCERQRIHAPVKFEINNLF